MARDNDRRFWSIFRSKRQKPIRRGQRPDKTAVTLLLERLEDRSLPSASYVADVANPGKYIASLGEDVAGTADSLTLRLSTSGQLEYKLNKGSFTNDLNSSQGGTQPLAANLISRINVSLGAGNDILTIDNSRGLVDPQPNGIVFDGSSGADSLVIAQDTSFTLGNAALSRGAGSPIALTGVEAASLTGGASANMFDLSGWTGTATLNGGSGTDRLQLTQDTDFTLANSSLTRASGGALTLAGIEDAGLTGGSNANTFDLTGWSGTASLDGLDATNTLVAGQSTLLVLTNSSLTRAGAGIILFQSIQFAQLTAGNFDSLIDASAFSGNTRLAAGSNGKDTIIGGSGNDLIIGGNAEDILFGGPGDDTIYGIGSKDTLDGGPGNDYLDGGNGNDTLTGGPGINTVIGGLGTDLLVETGDGNFGITNSSTPPAVPPGPDGTAVVDVGINNDIENATLTGGPGDNTFYVGGWTAPATLDGGDSTPGFNRVVTSSAGSTSVTVDPLTGTMTLSVGGGAVFTVLHIGNMALSGSDGNDTLDFSSFTGAVSVNNLGQGNDLVIGGQGQNIFNKNANEHGNKKFIGGPAQNNFNLGPGSDIEVISTSSNNNTLSFDLAATGVTFDLNQTDGTVQTVDEFGNTVAATGLFPILTGSSFSDTLTGAENATVLAGGGDDLLIAAGGANMAFDGGLGDDQLAITGGSVSFDGGTGDDQVTISSGTVSFDGDLGDDQATITGGTVSFDGGAGDDETTITGGTVTFGGGDDADAALVSGGSVGFDGGDGADAALVSGGSVSFDGGDGADITAINGGTISFDGDAGDDVALINGGIVSFVGGDDADTAVIAGGDVSFDGGTGDDQAVVNGGSVTFDGSLGDDQLNVAGGTVSFIGGDDSDAAIVSGGDVSFIGGDDADSAVISGGTVSFDGGDDSDSAIVSGGTVSFDGSVGDDQLTLSGGTVSFDGGEGADSAVVTGGSVSFIGGAGDDTLLQSSAPPPGPGGPPPLTPQAEAQLVYLDFDSHTDSAAEHVYTQQERDEIQQRLEDYYAPFGFVQFTQTPPSGTHATIIFNRLVAFGTWTDVTGPGGISTELDFRNLSQEGTAYVQVNGFLGVAGKPEATSANWVAASAGIAAHELGHMLGLQHTDSFGPIGLGIHVKPGSDVYIPAYPGPVAAFETRGHISASPASVGSSLFDLVAGTYFGERESIKLTFDAFADAEDAIGTVVAEQAAAHGSSATAQGLTLVDLPVPNTLASTAFYHGMAFNVDAVAAVGAIDGTPGDAQPDYYSFQGQAGDVINLEVMSRALLRPGPLPGNLDSVITVYGPDGLPVEYYGSEGTNDDVDFVPLVEHLTDSALIDLRLFKTGTYTIKVSSFNNQSTGAYELLVYRFVAVPQSGGGGDDGGSGGTGTNTFIGGAGNDTVYANGGSNLAFDGGLDQDQAIVTAGSVDFDGGDGADAAVISGGTVNFDGDLGSDAATVTGGTVSFIGGDDSDAAVVSGGTVSFDGGLGADAVTVSGGDVSFDGGDDSDAAVISGGTVNFDGDLGSDAATVTGGTVGFIGGDDSDAAVVSGGTVSFDGSLGADAVTVSGGDVSFDGGDDSDAAVISGGTMTFDGDLGSDAATVTGGEVSFDGGDDSDAAVISGGTVSFDGDLGSDSVTVTGGIVDFDGGDDSDTAVVSGGTVSFEGGDGADGAAVSGGTVIVNGGPGSDAVTVSGGTVTFNGGDGADAAIVSGGALTFNGEAGDDQLSVAGGAVSFDGGTGNDLFALNGTTEPGSSFIGGADNDTLVGAAGDDTFTLSALNAGSLNGTLSFASVEVIDGGAGTDTVAGTEGDDTFALSGNLVNGVTLVSIEAIDGRAGTDTVVGSAGDDIFTFSGGLVNGVALISIEVLDGGAGTDTVVGTAGNDVFALSGSAMNGFAFISIEVFDGGGGSDTLIGADAASTWYITGVNAGNVNGVLSFASIEYLVGGAVADSFVFAPGASIAGTVDGGAGSNTLDYSAFTIGITVNLGTGNAPATGGASNIRNVTGGAGNDNLIGDAVDNALIGGLGDDNLDGGAGNDYLDGGAGNDFLHGNDGNDILLGGAGDDDLRGGPGRDLMIGGLGADRLVGGPENDILIGGTTDFDLNRAALDALMAEWSSALSFAQRVQILKNGVGPGGAYKLNATTVHDDGLENVLTGSSGNSASNWFFLGRNDRITDTNTGDEITPLY